MERLCVSLETAKRLKAAGFPQYSSAVEFWNDMAGAWHIRQSVRNPVATILAAPTAQELADELPIGIKVTKNYDSVDETQGYIAWRAPEYGTPEDKPKNKRIGFPGDNMADAMASLWLALHEAQS